MHIVFVVGVKFVWYGDIWIGFVVVEVEAVLYSEIIKESSLLVWCKPAHTSMFFSCSDIRLIHRSSII